MPSLILVKRPARARYGWVAAQDLYCVEDQPVVSSKVKLVLQHIKRSVSAGVLWPGVARKNDDGLRVGAASVFALLLLKKSYFIDAWWNRAGKLPLLP
jgi:hypothetical protein